MPATDSTKATGDRAEKCAAHYLVQQGLKLVEQNVRSRYGEIDIIMRDAGEWVFLEVRYRKSQYYGGGLESVTRQKQLKLIKTAEHYIQTHHKIRFDACRFDIIEMTGDLGTPQINWIKDAFQADT